MPVGGKTKHPPPLPGLLSAVVLLIRCYVFLGKRRWFLIFALVAMFLGLISQFIAVTGGKYVPDDQFKFTGKYGCFHDWKGHEREAMYPGVSVLLLHPCAS